MPLDQRPRIISSTAHLPGSNLSRLRPKLIYHSKLSIKIFATGLAPPAIAKKVLQCCSPQYTHDSLMYRLAVISSDLYKNRKKTNIISIAGQGLIL